MDNFSIFMSSPGDVDDERRRAERVIRQLQHQFSRYLTLEPIFWEHQPQSSHQHFQEQIVPPSATDLVVCILWSRLGTRLPDDKYQRADGTPYRSGTEFEFEDAKAGYQRTGKSPDLWVYRKTAEVLVSLSDPLKAEKERQKALLDDFLEHNLGSADRHFKAGFNSFADAEAFERLFKQHLEAVLQKRCPQYQKESAHLPAWVSEQSPYRGLSHFDLEHAAVFYGRDAAIHDLLGQLQAQADAGQPFVLVFGASGAGKSSLLRAGLLHELSVKNSVAGVDHWRYALLRPLDAPHGDLLRLVAGQLLSQTALPELARLGFGDTGALAEQLREHPSGLSGVLQQALQLAGGQVQQQRGWRFQPVVRLVLLVDQMEEIFRFEAKQRDALLAVLAAFSASGAVWIVAAMRDEFYPQAAAHPLLSVLKTGAGQYDLPEANPAELVEMIRYPARAAGMDFESRDGQRLDALLLDSAAANRHALPLLEFTLDALYQRARGRGETLLSFDDFNALGGLDGAVASAAEAALQPLGEAALPAVRDMFRQLVDMDHGQKLPRRAPRADLATDALRATVLDSFIDEARLLVSGADGMVEIVHAALLRSWQRLAAWIDEDAELLTLRSRLEELAANWRESGHDAGYLLSPGKQEQDALLLQQQPWLRLDDHATQFLALSLQRIRRGRRTQRLTLVGSVTAFLILSGGFSWLNYQQRSKAETAANLALQAVNRLTYELPDRLVNIPGTLQILQQTFEQNADLLQRIDALRGETADSQREKAVNLSKQGEQRLAQGDLAGALVSYRASLAILEKLAEQDPANTEWQRDLSVSHNKIGEVQSAQGDLVGALDSYRADLAIAEKLAGQDPANTGWQRDLSVSYEKIGNVQRTQGDLAGALASYRASLAIREKLAGQDPANAGWQRDLSVSYNYIGNVQLAQGDLAGALASYRAYFAIAEKLAGQDPANAGWQRDLSVSHNKIGDVQSAQGDLAGALPSYRAGLAIAEKLASQDPANAEWQGDLAFSHGKLGLLLRNMNQPNEALAQFGAALAILEPLTVRAPDHAQWRQALATTKGQIAEIEAASGKATGRK